MRRAYIGLAGPLAYDYKNQADRPHAADLDAPNAILEDSLGLLMLYDELVFLSPQLCPQDMRQLPYVKFLNSRPGFASTFRHAIGLAEARYDLKDPRDTSFRNPIEPYEPALMTVTGQPFRVSRDEARFIPDNHTHGFHVADDLVVSASSLNFRSVLTDWITCDLFSLSDHDLIVNSATSAFYEVLSRRESSKGSVLAVGHRLIAQRLPNYLRKTGPYDPCLEELRNHPFIEEARNHLTEIVRSATTGEVDKFAKAISAEALRARNDVFRRHLKGANEYWVTGRAVLTEAAGLIIPGVGLLNELVAARNAERERAQLRWAGFVCDLHDLPGGECRIT